MLMPTEKGDRKVIKRLKSLYTQTKFSSFNIWCWFSIYRLLRSSLIDVYGIERSVKLSLMSNEQFSVSTVNIAKGKRRKWGNWCECNPLSVFCEFFLRWTSISSIDYNIMYFTLGTYMCNKWKKVKIKRRKEIALSFPVIN